MAETASSQHARRVYRALAVAAVLVLAIGTVTFRYLEGWSWVDAFYFSSVAVTTVGFGDLVPTSDAAKLFTVAYIFAGIGIVGAFIHTRLERSRLGRRYTGRAGDGGDPPAPHR